MKDTASREASAATPPGSMPAAKRPCGGVPRLAGLSLGVAALLATLMTLSPSINVFTEYTDGGGVFPSFAFVSMLAAVAACVLLTACFRRGARARRAALVVCIVAFVVGNVGYVAAMLAFHFLAATSIPWNLLAVVVGLGSPAACLLWSREFRYLDVTSALRVTAAACILYGAYVYATSQLGLACSVPLFLSCVAWSVAVPLRHGVLGAFLHEPSPNSRFTQVFAEARPNLLPPVLGLAVFAFVMGFRRGGMDVDENGLLSIGFVVAGAVTVALSLVPSHKPPIELYYRHLLPVCAVVMVPLSYLFSLAGMPGASMVPIYVLFGVVGAFSLAAIAIFGQNDEFNGMQLVAGVYALYCVMSFFGLVLIERIDVTPALQAMVFVGLSLAYSMFLSLSPSLFGRASGGGVGAAEGADRPADYSLACEKLAARNSLSPREAQILALLARGFSASYISGLLLISDSTARTHVNNIYRKLEVGSRDELLVLVDEMTGET